MTQAKINFPALQGCFYIKKIYSLSTLKFQCNPTYLRICRPTWILTNKLIVRYFVTGIMILD